MTTAGARLLELSGLSGVAASVHFRAMVGATGSTAGEMLFNRSSLRPSATAGAHLMDGGGTRPNGAVFIVRFRRRCR